ncbi:MULTISPECIES: UDP-2,4-diacetamido-2,4,6-trideoxy-beta-L-altropyranose hydrolase [Halomonas]|uniref:UDP-4-amino-4, 6-dideoxy-N-acetyl-beta-L-altrosamine N-acetyltransferase/UDP-2,4-diacetamido-2,4, 6-trideoxy-beta-L-altropyranose hydrolase,TIGR03590 n=1 Tax=Halomonas ventosae TaxID=229007 RepID=A0A4R6I5Q8_9GAMM|nr:UDP-2,4-diacetamido-2,4,6-trideoxy-beta-L-altropyranose hydrolase [Halomonas ventosae]TDO16637.1 UDP-4-amino-4,6-dideoxy-N-acetyl-beta-L-altrosamine N-acetyltransferase/UDP-2,4-diacetamido-2,4,6-trideoxy-beta-L-altropyranose hydrolase,TIGR03590 [Halomonas ventosae]
MSEAPISSCLQGQVVAFRADASLEIGSGHVMRCLTLAEALKAQGAECHFLCREHPGHLCELIAARGFAVHRLPLDENAADTDAVSTSEPEPAHAHWLGASWVQDAAACQPILAELAPAWLVVDHYALDHRWETAVLSKLSGSAPRLLVIDDLADRRHVADLLLDQNLGRRAEDYRGRVPEACQVLAGPRYALLRPEFREWREASLSRRAREPRLQRLLINLGGVDKDNVTGQVLDALTACDLPDDLQISVVMGASAPWRKSVTAQAREMPWPTEVVVNVSDMARRMAEADLAIGAAGSTSWERCCLGLPTLMVVLADNQREIADALAGKGAALPLDLSELEASLVAQLAALTAPDMLSTTCQRAADLVDGKGATRVMAVMQGVGRHILRPMQEPDLERVLAWRNHPQVRRHMYTQRLITLDEHRGWFERASQAPQRHLLIYEQEGEPLGFVNLNVVDTTAGRAEWGFYLAPDAPRGSGQGLGQCILTYAFTTLRLHKLCGEVLADNTRSQGFHERLGFRREATHRDHFHDGNTYHDVIGFGLLAEEWRDSQGADIP